MSKKSFAFSVACFLLFLSPPALRLLLLSYRLLRQSYSHDLFRRPSPWSCDPFVCLTVLDFITRNGDSTSLHHTLPDCPLSVRSLPFCPRSSLFDCTRRLDHFLCICTVFHFCRLVWWRSFLHFDANCFQLYCCLSTSYSVFLFYEITSSFLIFITDIFMRLVNRSKHFMKTLFFQLINYYHTFSH